MTLAGRTALVTGAARGLGAAIARLLAEAGAEVVLADIADAGPEATAIRATGGHAEAAALDVTDEAAWSGCIAAIRARQGRLDILVNNAGIIGRQRLADMPREAWERVLAVNLTGAFLGIRAAVPLMRAGGGGAMEFAADGIRVNSIHPATIATAMAESGPPGHLEANRASIPLGREAAAEEVARVVVFLCGPDASFMTGSEIAVDGGYSGVGAAHLRDALRARLAEGEGDGKGDP